MQAGEKSNGQIRTEGAMENIGSALGVVKNSNQLRLSVDDTRVVGFPLREFFR